MLQAIHLKKIYKPKKGVPVTAVDDVSIRFPEHGMIFLLGKSGSGKSTLLNLLGGLDQCDSGEIMIKGVSSKDFDQEHFDSYRNTYVGFIFQEYNILEEFTIGANIALALELQGKKATDEEINRILEEVDLAGYGSRRPNELSGGQRQRVAIARALVKNPRIIMADEPTGALDSNTGRQVLETLQKLSKDKLVIVVSHDQAFARKYGDRVIELADGRIVRDVEYVQEEGAPEAPVYEERRILIPPGYHLTEEDRHDINAYLERLRDGEVSLEPGEGAFGRRRERLTDESKIVVSGQEPFRLIRSRLSWKNGFKIGAGALKHKKFRLTATIFLSCIAFGLFGLADTFAAYHHVKTSAKSIMDTGISYASVGKTVKEGEYYYDLGYTMGQQAIDDIQKNTGVKMRGVYQPFGWEMSFGKQFDKSVRFTETEYEIYADRLNGFLEVDKAYLDELGYELVCGRLPDGKRDEIVLSEYVCETFFLGKYKKPQAEAWEEYETVASCQDMVGKTLLLGERVYTITGIVDTHFDLERYKPLTQKREHSGVADRVVEYALYNEFCYEQHYSLGQVAMVGEGYLDEMYRNVPQMHKICGGYVELSWSALQGQGEPAYFMIQYAGEPKDVPKDAILWCDGEKTSLAEDEIIVSASMAARLYGDENASVQELLAYVQEHNKVQVTQGSYMDMDSSREKECRVVGILDMEAYLMLGECILCNSRLMEGYIGEPDEIYAYAVGAMPHNRNEIEKLVSYCCSESGNVQYQMKNRVMYELDLVRQMLQSTARIFWYVGLGFAVFAMLLLANFIATSIAYKKQEIGILRAIGARSNDVFRIFFAESFCIAVIIWGLSCVGVGLITAWINYFLRHKTGILITILDFGIRQVLFLGVISMAVVALASFFPVKRIASRRPIDTIRNR